MREGEGYERSHRQLRVKTVDMRRNISVVPTAAGPDFLGGASGSCLASVCRAVLSPLRSHAEESGVLIQRPLSVL